MTNTISAALAIIVSGLNIYWSRKAAKARAEYEAGREERLMREARRQEAHRRKDERDLRGDILRWMDEPGVRAEKAEAEVERLDQWQCELADRMPIEYDGDEAQEALIERWVDGLTDERDALRAAVARVEALADEWEHEACCNASECVRCLAYQSATIRVRRALRGDES